MKKKKKRTMEVSSQFKYINWLLINSIVLIDDKDIVYPEGTHQWHEKCDKNRIPDVIIDWDAFHKCAHKCAQGNKHLHQYTVDKSNSGPLSNHLFILLSVNNKHICSIKCWVRSFVNSFLKKYLTKFLAWF
jgi:hypothetical protein